MVRGDDFYMRAFSELSSCRDYGGGSIGPIPWHHVIQYGSLFGLDVGMMDVFVSVIRELDEAFLEDQRAAQNVRRRKK